MYYKKSADDPKIIEKEDSKETLKQDRFNQKPNIGIFLQNKQMMFGEDSLIPAEDSKPSLIDYNAFKKKK